MGVCIWLYYKKGRGVFILLAFVSCVLLTVINHNFYALLAIRYFHYRNIRFNLPAKIVFLRLLSHTPLSDSGFTALPDYKGLFVFSHENARTAGD